MCESHSRQNATDIVLTFLVFFLTSHPVIEVEKGMVLEQKKKERYV